MKITRGVLSPYTDVTHIGILGVFLFQGAGYNKLIWAIGLNQLSLGSHCHLWVGLKKGYPLNSTVHKDVGIGIIHKRSLVGRAECTTFPTFYEAITVWCLA